MFHLDVMNKKVGNFHKSVVQVDTVFVNPIYRSSFTQNFESVLQMGLNVEAPHGKKIN